MRGSPFALTAAIVAALVVGFALGTWAPRPAPARPRCEALAIDPHHR